MNMTLDVVQGTADRPLVQDDEALPVFRALPSRILRYALCKLSFRRVGQQDSTSEMEALSKNLHFRCQIRLGHPAHSSSSSDYCLATNETERRAQEGIKRQIPTTTADIGIMSSL